MLFPDPVRKVLYPQIITGSSSPVKIVRAETGLSGYREIRRYFIRCTQPLPVSCRISGPTLFLMASPQEPRSGSGSVLDVILDE